MLTDISIGRYFHGNSVLHRLDPRVKVILFIAYMICVFMVTNPVSMLLIFATTLFIALLSRIKVSAILRSVRPVLFLMIFIFVLNVLTIHEGETLWSWWYITITQGGLTKAVLMAFRLFLLIMSTNLLLTLTTTPLKLSDALESMGKPLAYLHVPVHEMAMMMSIALRFIPTLVEETDKIMKAQVSRGADYDTGSFLKRAKGYVTVLVPLFVSAFKRAEELAVAMDARCYRGGVGKTKLHPLKMHKSDVIWLLVLSFLAIAPVVLDLSMKIK